MPDIELRRLRPEDVPEVATFEREIAEISFPDNPVTDLGFYERKLRQAVDDRKADAIVALIDGKVVGWLWMAARENFTTKERYGDLRSFYVVPGQRGAGVAFALMREARAVGERQGYRRLVGRTAATNDAMKALYTLYGYEPKHVVYELAIDTPARRPARTDTRPELVSGLAPRGRSGGSRRSGNRGP